jgi:hypothetical protein
MFKIENQKKKKVGPKHKNVPNLNVKKCIISTKRDWYSINCLKNLDIQFQIFFNISDNSGI